MRVGPAWQHPAFARVTITNLLNLADMAISKRFVCSSTVQESVDLTVLAFDWRTSIAHLSRGEAMALWADDGTGELPPLQPLRKPAPWLGRSRVRITAQANITLRFTLTRADGRSSTSLAGQAGRWVRKNEVAGKNTTEDADCCRGYGRWAACATRPCSSSRRRHQGRLLRPITLWPFPSERLAELADQVHGMLDVYECDKWWKTCAVWMSLPGADFTADGRHCSIAR